MAYKTYKGWFRPRNPQKYRGDPTNIVYRSLWERQTMKYFDENENVLEWSSEEVIVRYKSPIDGRVHRYFVDFYVKLKDKDGVISEKIIEIKPEAQTKPPEVKSKPTKKYINEVKTWGVNSAKWEAADAYAKKRGWEFVIITEKQLNLR